MKFRLLVVMLVVAEALSAQQNKDILNYIAKYKHVAIDEMVRTGIPASITLAQGILESGCGKSPLAQVANNHFGIKCKTEWAGERYYQDDDEAQECFRVYEHAEASYVDHSDFLLTRYWYAVLFQLPPDDYKAWAHGLKKVGYATNPNYASILIAHIENYGLHQLDAIALELIEEKNKLIGFTEQPEKAKVRESKQFKQEPVENNEGEVFFINGLRAVKAKENEDPVAIAVKHKMDYSAIVLYNEMAGGERFKAGQNVFLEPKKLRSEEQTYMVMPGETMYDISQRVGIKLKELYALNLMKPDDQPYPTETLHLRAKRLVPPRSMSMAEYSETQRKMNSSGPVSTLAAPTNETPASSGIRMAQYEVQKSDTLYSIAQKFNLSVKQLQDINKLESTLLKPGQILVVAN